MKNEAKSIFKFLLKSAEEFRECLISNDDVLECPLPIFLISEELRDKDEGVCQISCNLELDKARWCEWSGMILNTSPGLGSPQLQLPAFDNEAELLASALAAPILFVPSGLESFLSAFFTDELLGGTAVRGGKKSE